MSWDAIRVPIMLAGNNEAVIGYAMIDTDFLRKVEPFPQMWGISFSHNQETGVIRSIDFFPHEVVEDHSIETTGEEKEVLSLEQGSN